MSATVIPFEPGSPMEKFFQQFGFQNMPNGMQRRHEFITGEGSGFFISPDGYAVTNNHVVDHAKSVQVTTDDGDGLHRQGRRHRSEDRPRPDQGRRQERLPLCEVRRPCAACRRLGGRRRQSVRPRRYGDRGHRLGARPRHRRRPLRRLHPDRRSRSTKAIRADRRSTSTAM